MRRLRSKRLQRPPRLPFPERAERQYRRWLLTYVKKLYELAVQILLPAYEQILGQLSIGLPYTNNNDSDEASQIDDTFRRIKQEWASLYDKSHILRFIENYCRVRAQARG